MGFAGALFVVCRRLLPVDPRAGPFCNPYVPAPVSTKKDPLPAGPFYAFCKTVTVTKRMANRATTPDIISILVVLGNFLNHLITAGSSPPPVGNLSFRSV